MHRIVSCSIVAATLSVVLLGSGCAVDGEEDAEKSSAALDESICKPRAVTASREHAAACPTFKKEFQACLAPVAVRRNQFLTTMKALEQHLDGQQKAALDRCVANGGNCPADPGIEELRQQGYDVSADCDAARNEHRATCAKTIAEFLDQNHPYGMFQRQEPANRREMLGGMAACAAHASFAGLQGNICRSKGADDVYTAKYTQCRGVCPAATFKSVGCRPDGAYKNRAYSTLPECGEIKTQRGLPTGGQVALLETSCECRPTPACNAYIDRIDQLSASAVGGSSINCNQAPNGVLRAEMQYDASGKATGVKTVCTAR